MPFIFGMILICIIVVLITTEYYKLLCVNVEKF